MDEAAAAVGRGGRSRMAGLWGSSAGLIISHWIRRIPHPVLVLAPNEREAMGLKEDLEFFLGQAVPLYPEAEAPSLMESEKRAILSERLSILTALNEEAPPSCVVAPVSGLLIPVPCREDLHIAALRVEKGGRLDPAAFKSRLLKSGFRASPMVTSPAEFSIRGDIVDIFPMASEKPVRIELFDEEVESIREIDLETQRSVSRLERLAIPLPKIDAQPTWTAFEDHLPAAASLVLLEPREIENRLTYHARAQELEARGESLLDRLNQAPALTVLRALSGEEGEQEFKVLPARGQGRLLQDIAPSIAHLMQRSKNLKILCHTEAEATRLAEVLREQGIRPSKALQIVLGRLQEGFQMEGWDQAYINHHELLLRLPVRRERKTRRVKARALESFSELQVGDLVVHLVHGIARFNGITRMEREGGEEDFLMLLFEGETLLYVPASKVHLVEKYIGGGGGEPKLDKLGGKSFSKRKDRVQEALRDLAADMLELEAAREEEKGYAFPGDDELQVLFDASFPYEDTADQVRAMDEIKNDMEKRKPMDRLLCGDVGFGKTELAIRAAFKAVSGGTQVAVLVPTTILAQQHYETFRTRLADYPVSVEVLSRFKSRPKQKIIIDAAREGRVDILIGTHRILSQDVGFKRLGLLIIDEEQRFGVVHKERLKKLKRTVDVLTMTATPIPRTLHMALVGLRDISNLEIPPEGRMPIYTQVIYKSDEVIKKAVLAEINRGGQVFFLHNRVETIDHETERVRRLAPSARVAFAHGQMAERDLEKVMMRFIKGKIDVLVCTTIIESGIDLPGVNTILIDRADRFGLADLHQLRGRVGRGHVRARAHLMIPREPLPDQALRRLKAVEELSQLGAGFQLALKDLEIRGAGNILGAEQHGHIAAVGYELYCRLLRQTILTMKGIPQDQAVDDVDLDIRADAFIPPSYIPDEGLRMEILRKLGRRQDRAGLESLEEELEDRFGRIPEPVRHLLDICLLRSGMAHCGIRRASLVSGGGHLVMDLFDESRYAATRPFKSRELRFIEPRKAHIHPPKGARNTRGLIKFLKSRLMAVQDPI
jgi:transcription-repair coupling factor (superfamily II helicase)